MQNINMPAPDGRKTVKVKQSDTTGIMKTVIDTYHERNKEAAPLAVYLMAPTLKQSCKNVWNAIKKNVDYRVDPKGQQWVRTPARLWKDREGDCKSFSVMAASLLTQMGIPCVMRFASYKALSTTPTHVYVVVPDGNKEIIVDAVMPGFNQEKPYAHKIDYSMGPEVSVLSGIDTNTVRDTLYRLLAEFRIEHRFTNMTVERKNQYLDAIKAVAEQPTVDGFWDVFSSVTQIATQVGNIFGGGGGGGGSQPAPQAPQQPTVQTPPYTPPPVTVNQQDPRNTAANNLAYLNMYPQIATYNGTPWEHYYLIGQYQGYTWPNVGTSVPSSTTGQPADTGSNNSWVLPVVLGGGALLLLMSSKKRK